MSGINFFGLSLPGSGTGALGTRFSKGEHGAWFASLGILSGPGGTGVFPNIGYEFSP